MELTVLKTLFCGAAFLMSGLQVSSFASSMNVVTEHQSAYTILIPATPPESVSEAARELQRCVLEATGVRLPILEDRDHRDGAFISLGNTIQAKAAKILPDRLADEGFRMRTQEGNLYIVGPDTRKNVLPLWRRGYSGFLKTGESPGDGDWTSQGGTSNGTANGVYTFLEDYLNVRWLMPGELGRDVPSTEKISLPEIDRTESPLFVFRQLPYLAESKGSGPTYPAVVEWLNRQRLGQSIDLSYNHNWGRTVPSELFQDHPDWFAWVDGARSAPQGHDYKLETTNPELIRYFAEQAIKALRDNPNLQAYSLSPSDNLGWSESPESRALYDPPLPNGRPGMSSLILKFYHDVSEIVQRDYPEGRLSGFIYSDYLYPPTRFAMKLPENFLPMIAPNTVTYGYKLYEEERRKEWEKVMGAWADIAPETWFYYDLCNTFWVNALSSTNDRFAGSTGIITPPTPNILNFVFPRLADYGIKGARIYGNPSWSNAAVGNYLLAKMMWNPKGDAVALQQEWLRRAYGPEAGQIMERFYQELDSAFDRYAREAPIGLLLTPEILSGIYGRCYPGLERLYLEAASQPMTPRQKQRLKMIEANLTVLQWRLRNAGMLAGDDSPLRVGDEEIARLLRQEEAFPYFPEAVIGWRARDLKSKIPQWEFKPGEVSHGDKSALHDENLVPLYAAKDGELSITPLRVDHASLFATYLLLDRHGKRLSDGLLVQGTPILVPVRAGEAFFLYFPPRPPVTFELAIANASFVEETPSGKRANNNRSDAVIDVYYTPARSRSHGRLNQHAPKYAPAMPMSVFNEPGQKESRVIISKGGTGLSRNLLQSGHYSRVVELANLDEQWRFQPASKDVSDEQKVVSADFNDASWNLIGATQPWERFEVDQQGITIRPFEHHHGPSWYRRKLPRVERTDHQRLLLCFGGVKGDAEVWLNGKLVGRSPTTAATAEAPFCFDVTSAMEAVEEGVIAVRVTGRQEEPSNGLIGGVRLFGATPNR